VIKEFRDFVLRGNVVDLAVTVVIGFGDLAFTISGTESRTGASSTRRSPS
jgi:hypothetical protein